MKFALVNSARTEPQPKLHGKCQNCGADTVSRCGKIKLWHWAHKARQTCDPWWENETEWHRNWKSLFPQDWQEVIHFDARTGEKHIADVKSSSGLVVEFQNSPMRYEEMEAREEFYNDIIWIVNGKRGPLDGSYFGMGLGRSPIQTNPLAYSIEWLGKSHLLHNWSLSRKRVFLDFGNDFTSGPPVVWRLVLYDRQKKRGAVAPYPKHVLVQSIINGEEIGVPYLPARESSHVAGGQQV